MSKATRLLWLVLLSGAVAACRQDPPPEPAAPGGSGTAAVEDAPPRSDAVEGTGMETVPSDAVLVKLSADGGHLVDSADNALYFLESNYDGSKCDPACQEVWPPMLATGQQPAAGPGVPGEKLGVSPSGQGARHVTYNGHPLYRYAGDQGAGRTAGHGVSDRWGKWHLINKDGDAAADTASKATADETAPKPPR
jgi:predicted lipoprotein with Yx(FWY)xxD motif